VLLVEVKARRAAAATRAASVSAAEDYHQTLGKAFKQINRSYQALRRAVPEFAHVPKDRPVLGLVATLDPWYLANSFARDFLPTTDIGTMVASVRDIEHLVGIAQRRPVPGILLEIMKPDDERRTWELSTALQAFADPNDRNPLLEQAWGRLPFEGPASPSP
jgi:hypothetical protein